MSIVEQAEDLLRQKFHPVSKQTWAEVWQSNDKQYFLKRNHFSLCHEADTIKSLPQNMGPRIFSVLDERSFIMHTAGERRKITEKTFKAALKTWKEVQELPQNLAHYSFSKTENFPETWERHAQVLLHMGMDDIYDRLMRMSPFVDFLSFDMGQRASVLDHGDMHFDNFVFDGERAVLIDWPETTLADPALTGADFVQRTYLTKKVDENVLLDWGRDTFAEAFDCAARDVEENYYKFLPRVAFYQFMKIGTFFHPDFFEWEDKGRRKMNTLTDIMEDGWRFETGVKPKPTFSSP